jgi:hypothetical protein
LMNISDGMLWECYISLLCNYIMTNVYSASVFDFQNRASKGNHLPVMSLSLTHAST